MQMDMKHLIVLTAYCIAAFLCSETAAKAPVFHTDCNVTDCERCETDKAVCDPGGCRDNYGLQDNNCTACMTWCHRCDGGPSQCDNGYCHSGYLQMSTNLHCVKDCPIHGFAESNGACEACQVSSCRTCQVGHLMCDYGGCDEAYTTDSENKNCIACQVPNCLLCNTEITECEPGGCQLGFGVSADLENCEPCIPFCSRCDLAHTVCEVEFYYYTCNQSSPDGCPNRCVSSRFFFDNTTLECKACLSHCAQCTESEQKCDLGKCDEDYTLDPDGKCIADSRFWMMLTWILLGLFGLALILIACGVACYYMFDTTKPMPIPDISRPQPEHERSQQVTESSKGGKKNLIDVERNLKEDFTKGSITPTEELGRDVSNDTLTKSNIPESDMFFHVNSEVDDGVGTTKVAPAPVAEVGVKGAAAQGATKQAHGHTKHPGSAGTKRANFTKGGGGTYHSSPRGSKGSKASAHRHFSGDHAKGAKR